MALMCIVSMMAVASGAQAIVVNDQGTTAGVALVPGSSLPAGVTAVTSNPPCVDPALSLDLSFGGQLHVLPNNGLCYHGGPVMHANETIAEVWDPKPHSDYASQYVEQFLRDVADASGSLGSPYSVTTQYTDGGGRAGNASLYGGGYDTSATGYPANGCSPTGNWHYYLTSNGMYIDAPPYPQNDVCLTDAQLQSELRAMVAQEGLVGHIQPGYSPLLVFLMPPGVEVCLDSAATLCSANSNAAAVGGQFCSYHSQVAVGGQTFGYVVQPWTSQTSCDEPDSPKFPTPTIDAQTLATDTGARLVSPLSRAEIAAIVNPAFNGWFALDGSEMNDNNGCVTENNGLDKVTIGTSKQNPYLIQREFNNGGVIVQDPWAPACAPWVTLAPSFVVPSAANPGDVVKFDGSKSPSTLLIPQSNYLWDFGDGTGDVGSSVFHTYAKSGTYAVKLTVLDRGRNARSLSQTITVLGPTQVTPAGLQADVQLMPQGLGAVLRSGLAVKVTSNVAADGIAMLSIPRSAAVRAHLKAGRGPSVVIGQGTVSGITKGTTRLRLHLSRAVARKLQGLRHVVVTVRLALVAAGGRHFAIDAAGHY